MARSLACKLSIIGVGIILISSKMFGAISSYSKNDPYPVYTSLDPHTFLYTFQKQTLKGIPPIRDRQERLSLSISPFGQNADQGKDEDQCPIELGDLGGRWGMIGLLFGPLPEGQVLPPSLAAARNCLFPNVPAGTPITDPFAIDNNPSGSEFGFFSIPLVYRKRGLRCEFEAYLCHDLGLKVDIGVVDICQTATSFNDLTCNATLPPCFTTPIPPGGSFDPNNPNLTINNVEQSLMDNLKPIAAQIGLDICPNFHKCSVEDIRGSLYWRHAFVINRGRDPEEWPLFLFTPFVSLDGSIAAGKERKRDQAFALSFGSNDHHAIGANAGIDIDFADTVEIGAEFGFAHFFDRSFCNMFIPTSKFQSGIYPFKTDVNIQPGSNWHFGAKMSAYHFLDYLSFFFQYVLIEHKHDRIILKKPDPAFMPEILECHSGFKVHLANIAFNYDISPNICLGLLWQAPLKQANAYRSTTILFTLNITY